MSLRGVVRARLRYCRANLCNIVLGVMLCAVLLFLLSVTSDYVKQWKSNVDSNQNAEVGGLDAKSSRHGSRHHKHKKVYDQPDVLTCRAPELKYVDDSDLSDSSDEQLHDDHAGDGNSAASCRDSGQLFYVVRGTLRVNTTVLGSRNSVRCEQRVIDWSTGDRYVYSEPKVIQVTRSFKLDLHQDFMRIQCFEASSTSAKRFGRTLQQEREVAEESSTTRHSKKKSNLVATNVDIVDAARESHRQMVRDLSPRVVGSVGVPDLSSVINRQLQMTNGNGQHSAGVSRRVRQSAVVDDQQLQLPPSGALADNDVEDAHEVLKQHDTKSQSKLHQRGGYREKIDKAQERTQMQDDLQEIDLGETLHHTGHVHSVHNGEQSEPSSAHNRNQSPDQDDKNVADLSMASIAETIGQAVAKKKKVPTATLR